MDFIKKLQNKPEHYKKTLMWFSTIIIMAVIFAFWVLTFPFSTPPTPEDQTLSKAGDEMPGVWQTLKSQTGEVFNLWRK